MQSDRDTAKYSARTEQLFAEAGYGVQGEWLNLEPFVNLAYVNFENNGIAESGGAAALRGDKQHTGCDGVDAGPACGHRVAGDPGHDGGAAQ